jgi:hypothetical protein
VIGDVMEMIDGGDVASEISRIPSGEHVSNCAETIEIERKNKSKMERPK